MNELKKKWFLIRMRGVFVTLFFNIVSLCEVVIRRKLMGTECATLILSKKHIGLSKIKTCFFNSIIKKIFFN